MATDNQRNWGFGWNHKRVYRELELNLRIKPKKRLFREKPKPLEAPDRINVSWSMDFMHDQLCDNGLEYISTTLLDWADKTVLILSLSNQETHNKMRISNAITGGTL